VADGMGVEGGDDHRPPLVRAALHRPPHDRLVAEVEAVEIAERQDGATKVAGDGGIEGQALHRFARLANRRSVANGDA
jgi:hypothetical protein